MLDFVVNQGMMLKWRPWLSVRDFACSPRAKLVLAALLLVQVLAPNWIIWERNGAASEVEAAGTAHGFRIAPGSGRQAVICFYRSQKPLAAREALVRGPKVFGRTTFSPTQVISNLPGACSSAPALFAVNFKFEAHSTPAPWNPLLSEIRDHPGRAPPSELIF